MTTPPFRIAINGFGRIGRTVLRILMRERPEFDLVCINEIEPLETCAYLFQYDSVFGPWPGTVATRPGALLRVFGWYDNEWGFSARMLDMAALIGRRAPPHPCALSADGRLQVTARLTAR